MHGKRASTQTKVRRRKGILDDTIPETKPAEREDKGQGRGEQGGEQSVWQQNKYNRRASRDVSAKVRTNNGEALVHDNKISFILKTENP